MNQFVTDLGTALNGAPFPETLARLLRLPRAESDLLLALFDASDSGLTPEQLRAQAPACYSPSLVSANLNRKLKAAGIAARVANFCQRGGPGRQVSIWRLLDEPLNDAA
jgi:hypothetical protein